MPRIQKRAVADDSDGADASPPAKKSRAEAAKAKTGASESLQNKVPDGDGGHYWELSKLRRVGTSEFKGQILINIREYYEDKATGDPKPGKKGISLSLDQYRRLLEAIPEINAVLGEQGHDMPGVSGSVEEAPAKPKGKKSSAKQKKSNIEATSDEEGAGQDGSDGD